MNELEIQALQIHASSHGLLAKMRSPEPSLKAALSCICDNGRKYVVFGIAGEILKDNCLGAKLLQAPKQQKLLPASRHVGESDSRGQVHTQNPCSMRGRFTGANRLFMPQRLQYYTLNLMTKARKEGFCPHYSFEALESCAGGAL